MHKASLEECLRRFKTTEVYVQLAQAPDVLLEEIDASEAVRVFVKGFLTPATTSATSQGFAPCLVSLLSRLDDFSDSIPSALLTVALCRLARLRPALAPRIQNTLNRLPKPFTVETNVRTVHGLCEEDVYFHLLAVVQSGMKLSWQLSDWNAALHHPCEGIRWCGVGAVAIYLCLSEETKNQLMTKYGVSETTALACNAKLAQMDSERLKVAEVWGPNAAEPISVSKKRPWMAASEMELPPDCVQVAGVMLPTARSPQLETAQEAPFILTTSMEETLFSAALALNQHQSLLIEGPPGSGKTCCLHHLLDLTQNRDAIWIQIEDQMDAKSLVGAYVCTSTPGQFRWQPGPLAEAVSGGKWVIIEDINVAPSEVLASLIPVLENGKLSIPQRAETLTVQEGFQLIATVTSGPKGASGGAYGSADHVKMPSPAEQMHILESLFPDLKPLLPVAYASLLFIQCLAHQCSLASLSGSLAGHVQRCLDKSGMTQQPFHVGRHFSLRDICKWCHRFQATQKDSLCRLRAREGVEIGQLPFALRHAALAECHDCYAAFLPSLDSRRRLMTGFASLWCLTEQDVDYHLQLHKPAILVDGDHVRIGRSILPVLKAVTALRRESHFVHTGHSARLMERLAASLQLQEPLLLVGETGTGKTAMIQHIAHHVGAKLTVLNLSQQTDSSDLMGGYKPISPKDILLPLVNPFLDLLRRTWTRGNNESYIARVIKYAERHQWEKLEHAFQVAIDKSKSTSTHETPSPSPTAKRQKQDLSHHLRSEMEIREMEVSETGCRVEWGRFEEEVQKACRFRCAVSASFAFQFVEGTLLKALKQGEWLFLDEINLAPPEALHSLAAVLEPGSTVSLHLTDRGATTVQRHPDFRLMAAMNPATDFGKRDLAAPLRNKFTEFWFSEPECREDLEMMVSSALSQLGPVVPISRIVGFYLKLKEEAKGGLSDGAGQSPCYSLRTLHRFLEYLQHMTRSYGLQRALLDGAAMAFATQLDPPSASKLMKWIQEELLTEPWHPSHALRAPQAPTGNRAVLFEQFWIETGSEEIPLESTQTGRSFVLTPSIRANLRSLARAVSMKNYPILLQGPTSSGKTSLVSYLATQTGHRMVRINNHEHTDLQEYLGCYIADERGQLVFVEGALVQAVRKGYWVLLDELNLAPSEVLEALNRLLDDNREIYVPDMQQAIKPHPHFMLFATQNPPRHYAGRKHLSRAFRSRFLELNIDDIPDQELAEILEKRSKIPPSFATKMVAVMRELQRRRQMSNAFAGKHGYITPRDLFRWAERGADGYPALAENGFHILAERLRSTVEKKTVLEVLMGVMKVPLRPQELYKAPQGRLGRTEGALEWIPSTVRIFRLVEKALASSEAVLLIGETGTGKTSVCQKLAEMNGQKLHILNCNLHTETSDFVGGFRPVRDRSRLMDQFQDLLSKFDQHPIWQKYHVDPVEADVAALSTMELLWIMQERGSRLESLERSVQERAESKVLSKKEKKRLRNDPSALETLKDWFREMRFLAASVRMPFIWEDGVLVEAMKKGDMLLIDELNLAEDAVLERMNSVLDIGRTLTLAEKGGEPPEVVIAHPDFRIVATMNPGGDFGKKELSPALANRFTQIWVPSIEDPAELKPILQAHFHPSVHREELIEALMQFAHSFREWTREHHVPLTIRDLLAVAQFVNQLSAYLGPWAALLHGIAMVFLDGLEISLASQGPQIPHTITTCAYELLQSLIPEADSAALGHVRGELADLECEYRAGLFSLGPFGIDLGSGAPASGLKYDLTAPTPKRNVFRLLRAMQLKKAVLLEGSPGVGKTSLVSTLAALTGHRLIRINLSEQTDMMDLLGADLPVPDGKPGEFRWCDGPLLSAMRAGDWVLLDELNLANQQILEGLNALTDHRGEIFIPELSATFVCPPSFRLFASQNPIGQGGGRKGLPKSFLNRFTRVYTEPFEEQDLKQMSEALCGDVIRKPVLLEMVQFLSQVSQRCSNGQLGRSGGPWEFNLRDFLRWCALLEGDSSEDTVMKAAEILFFRRFRSSDDNEMLNQLYREIFQRGMKERRPRVLTSDTHVVIGDIILKRDPIRVGALASDLFFLPHQIPFLESLAVCVDKNWPALIIGPVCSGKTSLVRSLAALCNKQLVEISLTSGTDASDLLGGFEKSEANRDTQQMLLETRELMRSLFMRLIQHLSADVTSQLLLLYDKSLEFERQMEHWTRGDAERSSTVFSFLTAFLQNLMDFLHHYQISDDMESDVQRHSERLERAANRPVTSAGCFEWVDGALVKAMQRGDWVLLDLANLCNPTVLDRLNSVMEPNGVLHLNECGGVNGESRVIQPHPDFRLFLAYDPRYGEISRAMRNRSLESYMSNDMLGMEKSGFIDLPMLIQSTERMDASWVAQALSQAHGALLKRAKLGGVQMPTTRDFKRAISLYRALSDDGISPDEAIQIAYKQVYCQRELSKSGGAMADEVLSNVLFEYKNSQLSLKESYLLQECSGLEWMSQNLTVKASLTSSSFSALCRETAIFTRHTSSSVTAPDTWIAARVVASRMSPYQLRYLSDWLIHSGCSNLYLREFARLLMEKREIQQFMESMPMDALYMKLLPLDPIYWSPSIRDERLPSDVLGLVLKLLQLQSQCSAFCKETNFESLTKNSLFQLSYLRSTDAQFRPNLKHVHPALMEWIYPVLCVLVDFMEAFLEPTTQGKGEATPEMVSLLYAFIGYLHRFWHQWASLLASQPQTEAFTEEVIFVWIKIKKIARSLNLPERLSASLSERWKLVSRGMNGALELPQIPSHKPLLWKHGGHPKMHRDLHTAQSALKLGSVCRLLSEDWKSTENDLQYHSLLHELGISENMDPMEVDAEGQEEDREEKSQTILSGLVSDSKLRRFLCQLITRNADVCVEFRTLMGALSIASLAAHSSDEAEKEAEHVVQEALELSLAEIAFARNTICEDFAKPSWTTDTAANSMFLPSSMMHSAPCRAFQSDLRRLQWSLSCTQSLSYLFPLLLETCGMEEPPSDLSAVADALRWSIQEGIECSLCPIQAVAVLQDLLWLVDTLQQGNRSSLREHCQETLCPFGNAWYQWQASLVLTQLQLPQCDHTYHSEKLLGGPAVAYQGSLVYTVDALMNRSSSILDAPARLLQLKLASRHLLTACQSQHSASIQFLHGMRIQIAAGLMLIVSAHLSSFPEQSRATLKQLLQEYCHSVEVWDSSLGCDAQQHLLRCLRFHIGQSSHAVLATLTESCILPCCQLLLKPVTGSWAEMVAVIGKAWVLLGMVRLSLAVPPVGVDPATKHRFKAQHLNFALSAEMEPELSIRRDIQSIPGGFDETDNIEQLQTEIAETKKEIATLDARLIARPAPAQYLKLHHQITQYLDSHGVLSRIVDLVEGLEKQSAEAIRKAQNWMDASKGFLLDVEREYPLYQDIHQPFLTGILEICHGLSAMISASKIQSMTPTCAVATQCAEDLMTLHPAASIPVVGTTEKLEELGQAFFDQLAERKVEDVDRVVFEMQLSCLQAALHSAALECRCQSSAPSHAVIARARFCSIAQNLMHVFEKLEACKDAKAEEEAQFFKSKPQTLKLDTDEDMEEASYKAMFPDHTQEFADLAELELDEMPSCPQNEATDAQAQSSQSESLMQGAFLRDIVQLHHTVFGEGQLPEGTDQAFSCRYRVGQMMLHVLDSAIPRTTDDVTLTGLDLPPTLYSWVLSKAPVAKGEASQSKAVDLEMACLEEVQLTQSCLLPLKMRLDGLLKEWPDNPILCQLKEICNRILSMPLTSPVKRVLTGLELLLAKSQTWEEAAASHVSLSVELKQVSGLVVRWQRMELESWRCALDRLRERHSEGAYKTWFYIFRILSDAQSALKMDEVSSALEEYLTHSTQGEFSKRLMILKAFLNQLGDIQEDSPLVCILQNLIAFYSQYKPLVEEALEKGLEQIEKELHDFVKLQKWEDRGYFSMKKAGERAQRKLHRLCRLAEEVLKTPAATALAQISNSTGYPELTPTTSTSTPLLSLQWHLTDPVDCGGDVEEIQKRAQGIRVEGEDLSVVMGLDRGDRRFNQLPRIVERMRSLCQSSPVAARGSRVHASLDGICGSILNRIQELQKDKSKAARARKKKALSDYMGVLLEMGISRRRADIPKDELSVRDWFEKPALGWQAFLEQCQESEKWSDLRTEAVEGAFSKADSYYYRCVDRMQRIWDFRKQPAKDLSLSEIQSLTNSAEYFLFLLRSQRAMLNRCFMEGPRLVAILEELTGLHCEADAVKESELSEMLCLEEGRTPPPLPCQSILHQWLDAQWEMFPRLQRAVEFTEKLLMSVQQVEDRSIYKDVLKEALSQCREIHHCAAEAVGALGRMRFSKQKYLVYRDLILLIKNFRSLIHLSEQLAARQKLQIPQTELNSAGFRGNCLADVVPEWRALIHQLQSTSAEAQHLLASGFHQESHSIDGIQRAWMEQFGDGLNQNVVHCMLWIQAHHQYHLPDDPDASADSILITENLTEALAMFKDCFGFERLSQICLSLRNSLQKLTEISEMAWSGALEGHSVQLSQLLAAMLKCLEPTGVLVSDSLKQLLLLFMDFHQETCKLCYISLNVILGLLKDGFCTQPDGEPQEDEGTGPFEEGEGTGMAEGEGRKDVSDEIENEDQITGTQKREEPSENPDNTNQQDAQGIEMENDFDGRLENLENEESKDPSDDEALEGEERLEDQMGKVGAEGETVDERLWDEENMEDPIQDSNEADGQGDSSEYMDGQLDQEENEDKPQKKAEEQVIEPGEAPLEEDGEDEMDEEETEGEGQPQPGFTQPEQPEKELQLQDDMKLDGEEEDDDSLKGSQEGEGEAEMEEPPIQKFNEPEKQTEDPCNDDSPAQPEASTEAQDTETAMELDEGEEDRDPDQDADADSEPSAGDEMEVVPEERDGEEGEEGGCQGDPTGPSEKASAPAAGHQEGTLDDPTSDPQQTVDIPSRVEAAMQDYEAAPQGGPSALGSSGGGQDGAVAQAEQTAANEGDCRETAPHKQSANPLRSLGEALEEWKRDLNVRDGTQERQEAQREAEPDAQEAAMEYEFVPAGEAPSNTQQTLATATEEQLEQMGRLQNDQLEQRDQPESAIQAEENPEDTTRQLARNASQIREQGSHETLQHGTEKGTETDSGAASEMDIDGSSIDAGEGDSRDIQDLNHLNFQEGHSLELPEEPTENGESLSEQLYGEMDTGDGQQIWNQCQAATSCLTSELTEHLRLILEPTLASRLAGDYRTGKRINMKRVIPYVASQYRKDKIWLRRTKPDKRTYQVLLAIDDSKSMSENGCGHFALEALTLMTRAMSRLDVGELGLLSFGGSGKLSVLHPLGTPFTDANGPRIVQGMHFDQDNRIEDQPMLNLIQSLKQILDSAERQHHTAAASLHQQLHQLVIIIADGRFHEKTALKRQTHELCHRPDVLVAFIILDNPDHSLLDLSTVSFVEGQPQFRKYLDDFPFPYYIVLSNIAALPHTMADLLRQWFQISATSF